MREQDLPVFVFDALQARLRHTPSLKRIVTRNQAQSSRVCSGYYTYYCSELYCYSDEL